ncbi:hemerythrin domain-containing protein [Actinoplanes sp. CA-142083]|uniref:hemerythrin domain-containing protein n=1 Tax=Actinoplanes sp. CA-142083 TaxID=3239903 RepID=UPI003D8F877E
MSPTTTPYTHEMVIIHRVFRREAALLPRLADEVRAGDRDRCARVAAAVREYAGALHHHHHLEDELIWPKLYQRARLYDELVARMEDQHERLGKTLIAVDEALPWWEKEAGAEPRAALVERLHDHRAALLEHLCDEETQVLPLVADHLTVEEWDEVGRRGLETIPRGKAMLALGAILEEATPEEQQYFLGKVPVPGRVLWRLVGRRQYRRHVAGLRGAS